MVEKSHEIKAPIIIGLLGNFNLNHPIVLQQFSEKIIDPNFIVLPAVRGGTYDGVVVINEIPKSIRIKARKNFIWKLVQEPYVPGMTQFVDQHSGEYSRIYTHNPLDKDPRVQISAPMTPWFVGKTIDELRDSEIPKKTKTISAIASTKSFHIGHDNRSRFIEYLVSSKFDFDLFGIGRENQVDDKWDALAPYRYSIAIENSSQPNYWTEKIIDCFLAYTVPIYFGATNIDKYFPEDSYIWLPIDSPLTALDLLKETIETNDWERRLPALQEARRKCLEEYLLIDYLKKEFERNIDDLLNGPVEKIKIKGKHSVIEYWLRKLLHKL